MVKAQAVRIAGTRPIVLPGNSVSGGLSDHRRRVSLILLHGWLIFHAAILLGYALFGRGFAYVGIGKAFVGEICLGFGILWL